MKFSLVGQTIHEIKSVFFNYPRFVFQKNSDNLNGIPVFVYHTIDPVLFESQLIYLKENGYQTLSINEFVNCINGEKDPETKSILITVDDGRSSFWRFGYPLIKKYKMKAVLFIIPGRTQESTLLRKNLFQVWDGKLQIPEIISIDPDDQSLCNWLEIKEMFNSGVIDIESHSLFHKEVFVNSKILDFVDHRTSFVPSDTSITAYFDLEDVGVGLSCEKYYGRPLFKSAPLMQGQPALKVSEDILILCQDFYGQLTNREKDNDLWKKILRKRLLKSCFVTDIYQKTYEVKNAIKEDIQTARDLIQKNVDKAAGNHLCFPWAVGSDMAVQLSRELGVKSCFWCVLEGRRINIQGDDPYHMVRIKNDFIWRLPGNGRKSLLYVYFMKVKRRISGRHIY